MINQTAQALKIDTLKSSKVKKWVKLISITGGAQVIVQAIAFFSGILVVRLLSIQEYACYVIANTMLGTMTVLADGGITTGVMAQAAQVWNDKVKLGVVMASGFHLRKRFAIASLLVAVPVLIYLLQTHHVSWLMTGLICLALIPAFLSALSDNLLEIAPKLHQDIIPLQKNQIASNVVRLALLLATLFIFPWTYIAILSNGISRGWANLRLRKISHIYSDNTQKPDPEVTKKLVSTVKKILPTSIYYCLSGQITVWIMSIFGSTRSLAQIGALTGLATVLTLFNVVFNTLIVPRFARLPNDASLIFKRFLTLQLLMFALGGLIVLFVYLFSDGILWVLGSKFAHLNKEMVLVAVSSVIALISTCTNSLLSSRAIIVPPALYLPSIIAIQIGLLFCLPIHEVFGVLMYGILTSTAIYLIRLLYYYFTSKRKTEDNTNIIVVE